MENKVMVSVDMITYLHEAYITQAIEGVLMQETNFEYELIIADDCSPDNTEEVVRNIIATHPKGHIIKYFRHDTNIGMQPNGIFALQQCKGKYVAICEGDDYWTDPYKLQKQVDFLEMNPDYSICFHDVEILKDGVFYKNYITKVPNNVTTVEDLSKGNYIITCSSIFRNFFLIPDYFKNLNAGDYPLHLLLTKNGEKIYFFEESMGVYRIHQGGIYSSANPLKLSLGNIHLLTTLINEHRNKIVKENLRKQLVNILNYFKVNLIKKLDFRDFIYVFNNIYKYQSRLSSMKFFVKWLLKKK